MSEQMPAVTDGDGNDNTPEYRVSHLLDDLADAFSERDMVQTVAPFGKGGIKPRVKNRATFQYGSSTDGEDRDPIRREVEQTLETERFSFTPGGDPHELVVLGREVSDLRELREGDRVHVNKRRGPFQVYRVYEHSPEVLQRSDPAVSVELSNVDTESDWMIVDWKNDDHPTAYCHTKDKHAKHGFRYRKVEPVERIGRIGPLRMYSPDELAGEYQDTVLEMVEMADGNGGLSDLHPSDVERVRNLMTSPPADVFSPEDADLISRVMDSVSEFHDAEADALHIEDDEDREHAREEQAKADKAGEFADAFDILRMESAPETDERPLWVCDDCGKAYTNKHKYPTHRRLCPEVDG